MHLITVEPLKKMKFSITDFFSKCDQIRTLRIWSHLLKKSLMENFILCAVNTLEVTQKKRANLLKINLLDFLFYCILSKISKGNVDKTFWASLADFGR